MAAGAAVDRPIEAVIWDYGGVISSPLFRGIGTFEADLGYPPGSVLELIFGERAYVGNEGGGDPSDGATAAAPPSDGAGAGACDGDQGKRSAAESAVTHDWHRLEVGEITMLEYMTGVVERAPDIIGAPLDLDAYRQFMRDMPVGTHWPVVHRIRALRHDGIRLALLTNNVQEFGDAWRSTFPVDELFEVVVDSSHVGMRKPDPRIYLLTCERVGVDPDAAVFLDDNRDNVEAARALGMEVVHFMSDSPLPSLAELDAILARRGTRAAR